MYVYLDDRLVPADDAKVSVFDHGFLYGDGVYETMRAYSGVVLMLDEHIKRLFRSASMIGLDIKKDAGTVKTAIYKTLDTNLLKNAYIRLTVSRGYGSIGLDPELCKEATFVIFANEFRAYPEEYYEKGIKLIIAETRRNLKEALNPQIKSLNFLNNILAKIEAKGKGAYEALMLNSKGNLTEGTISNLFFVSNNTLCTPSIDCGILDGITRNVVISLAKKKGIAVKEDKFGKEDLYNASGVFITNSTMEIMPVCQVDEVEYTVGNITKLLHTAYKANVREYIKN
ncbi:MAG: branched-chain-amino-acid transaminase [Candidatus Omnitrophica bacterium]|nr:branched-chain-amino-acid transaminase [Candidatus Omnitrophota bacterium]